MNINNLYEGVPVEKELPPLRSDTLSITVGVCNQLGPSSRGVYDYENNRWLCYGSLEQPTQWLRPVTRESIEAFLREFGEKVWDISEAYNSNIDEDIPDKQTAITELIKQYTEQ